MGVGPFFFAESISFESMQNRRVVITGMGLVCPLPSTLDGFWETLLSGRDAVAPYRLEGGADAPIPVAAPADFNGTIDEFGVSDPGQKKAIKKSMKVMSREIQMAVASSCRALNHAGIQIGQFPSDRIGISFGSDYILSTVGDVADGIRSCCRRSKDGKSFDFSRWAQDGLPKMSPLWQLKYLPNMPSSHIAILNDFHGPSNSMTLREASIGACVGESREIIASGRADIMLVGTTGSRLHPIKMLAAMQQEELAPRQCRPFDRDRQGTVLGEGAAALVLEDLDHAERRGAEIWGEVVSASNRIRYDHGKTDLRREVLGTVMRDLLRRGRMAPEEIGHLNAHGLGNRASDRAEAQAINDIFGKRREPIPVVAMKGFFGNLGAGTGTVELIAGVLALAKKNLFPTLHFSTPDPECPIVPVRTNDLPSGNSFVKIAVNPQGQASGVLIRKLG